MVAGFGAIMGELCTFDKGRVVGVAKCTEVGRQRTGRVVWSVSCGPKLEMAM